MKNELDSIIKTIIQAVDRGNAIPIRITGTSMIPALNHGDKVYIRCCLKYEVSDVVVVVRNNHFIVHRIINKMATSNGEYYLTKGDNNRHIDRWYPHKNILAKVINTD